MPEAEIVATSFFSFGFPGAFLKLNLKSSFPSLGTAGGLCCWDSSTLGISGTSLGHLIVACAAALGCYGNQISLCGMGPVYSASCLASDLGSNGDGDTFAHDLSWQFPVPSSKAFQGPDPGAHSRELVTLGKGVSPLAQRKPLPLDWCQLLFLQAQQCSPGQGALGPLELSGKPPRITSGMVGNTGAGTHPGTASTS